MNIEKTTIPKLFFGCLKLGLGFNINKDLRILDYSYDSGINNFDTSLSYGYGKSIEVLGKFVRNKRDKVYISSKIGIMPTNRRLPYLIAFNLKYFLKIKNTPSFIMKKIKNSYNYAEFNPKIINQQIDLSLKKLNTDYIDLLSLHHLDIKSLSEENIFELNKLIKIGKIKNYGFSPVTNIENFVSKNLNNLHLSYDFFDNNKERLSKNNSYLIYSIFGNSNSIDKKKIEDLCSEYNLSFIVSMFTQEHILENIKIFIK
jgi:aryl-alcohol dehydrogenase-like predicted oxidoreductase